MAYAMNQFNIGADISPELREVVMAEARKRGVLPGALVAEILEAYFANKGGR